MLNLLSQNPELTVITRTSSFAFKGQTVDIAEITGCVDAFLDVRSMGCRRPIEGCATRTWDWHMKDLEAPPPRTIDLNAQVAQT